MPSDIPEGARVELLPDRENVYRFARAGARATVIDQREDDYGYPMVYVEWDQDVQEKPCWTFASHFRVLEVSQPTADEMIRRAEASRSRCPTCGQPHEPEMDKYAKHLDILSVATEAAAEADGYMVITMAKRYDAEGNLLLTPKVFLSTMTPLAASIVESQVVRIAQMYHHERIEAAILNAIEEEERGR